MRDVLTKETMEIVLLLYLKYYVFLLILLAGAIGGPRVGEKVLTSLSISPLHNDVTLSKSPSIADMTVVKFNLGRYRNFHCYGSAYVIMKPSYKNIARVSQPLECEDGSHVPVGRLCVQCLGDRLYRDPRSTLPAMLISLQKFRLRFAGANAVISSILDAVESRSFPSAIIKEAVQMIGVILKKQHSEHRDMIASSLIESCLSMSCSLPESRRAQLCSALIIMCLQKPYCQRLVVENLETLKGILVNPGIDEESRNCILDVLLAESPILDIFDVLTAKFIENTTTTPQHVAVLLDASKRVINALPSELSRDDLSRMIDSSSHLIQLGIKDALLSFGVKLQISSASCLLSIVQRNEKDLVAKATTQDTGVNVVIALNTSDIELFVTIIKCITRLIVVVPELFFTMDLGKEALQNLLRTLHLVIGSVQSQDENSDCDKMKEAALLGLQLVNLILKTSLTLKNGSEIVQQTGPQVISLIYVVLYPTQTTQSNTKELQHSAACCLEVLLKLTPKGLARSWANLMEVVKASAFILDKPKKFCKCFVLQLVTNAVSAIGGECSDSLNWATDFTLDHAKECTLVSEVNKDSLSQLLNVLLVMYNEPLWKRERQMAEELTEMGFLQYVTRDESLKDIGCIVLGHILECLARHLLGLDVSRETLQVGLKYQTHPWLNQWESIGSPEERDAKLILNYCNIIHGPTLNNENYMPKLTSLVSLLTSPLGSAERLPIFCVKAVLLLLAFACPQGDCPAETQNLLLRCAPSAHCYYTHHKALIEWAIAATNAPQELRAAIIAEWFAQGETPRSLTQLLKDHLTALPCVMDIIQGEAREDVASFAAQALLNTAQNGPSSIGEQLWLRLPQLLRRPNTTFHGAALLLQLASKLDPPTDPMLRFTAITPLCNLLTLYTSPPNLFNNWCRLSQAVAFKVARIVVCTTSDNQEFTGVSAFLHDVAFLKNVEVAANESFVEKGRRESLLLAAELASLQIKLGHSAHNAAHTIMVSPKLLLAALENFNVSSENQKLACAVLHLLQYIPEPRATTFDDSNEHLSYVALDMSDEDIPENITCSIYTTMHYLASRCMTCEGGDDITLEAVFRAMRAVLGWSTCRSLVASTTWTHMILWEIQMPLKAEVIRSVLLFTAQWTKMLMHSEELCPSEMKNLNTTLERLLCIASHVINYDGCRQALADTLSACLGMETELEKLVAELALAKLLELQISC